MADPQNTDNLPSPENQAEYTKAWDVLVYIDELDEKIKLWETTSASTIGELKEKEQTIAALKVERDMLMAKVFPIALLQSVTQPQATAPSPAPARAVGASRIDEPWKGEARTRAYQIIKRDTAKDLYPSQENIADEIAKQFRQEGWMGSDGKPLTGAYIKRWALKGISSAQSKLISTVNRRGK